MNQTFTVLLLLIAIGIGCALALRPQDSYCFPKESLKHDFIVAQANTLLGINLVDPEQAPPDIRDSVMRGYRLIMNTSFFAPNYALNELSCSSCHFSGGDSLGGKNGGISLVGVTNIYPQYSQRSGKVIDLADRIDNCFERSMNGRALPRNSLEMHDIITYLKWISKEVEHLNHIPWLGLPTLKSEHTPDPQEGEKIYQQYCMACHQKNGQGGGKLGDVEDKTIPPLWGPHSFNDGAGMNTMKMLAPFIYLNMPYQQAVLTEEQALDVAAFVLQQPRPHFQH